MPPVATALNCWVPLVYICAWVGEIVIATTRVPVLANLLVSPLATALMDTGLPTGGSAGAQ